MSHQLNPSNLVGRMVEVIRSTNKQYVGLRGRVLLETKHSFVLDCTLIGRKRLIKSALLQVSCEGNDLDGSALLFDGPTRIRGNL